ncbi:SusC/RagA family TonB-linked outer membrane protein [Arenibacter sp. S6351L]|uniref:SusC/RagA family TonB-linked outer membrane protein n=1 Tax=Arenibacter sp. S6351L TaxID=2926407 RepID=UPI001FF6740F|nr:SusC/RagA family TonB-linked outer membrane protein [Arenibacter sp. S6351L]MCK0136073.1 SusC/RagA family TonB-linked outer membrane protein [Arenibacter sp. S6351L]
MKIIKEYYIWDVLKLDLKMKLSFLFLFLFLFQTNASTYSQKTKISLDEQEKSIQSIFDKIEKITDFKFFYENEQFSLDQKVTIRVEKKQIDEILRILFSGSDVLYEIIEKQIILTKKKDIPLKKILSSPKIEVRKQIQQNNVSGTIVDENGAPLAGANILEKGTVNGTQADFDGNFTLEVKDKNAILVISYIGYGTKEVGVNGQTTINVSLSVDAAGLEEVIITGVVGGTKSKKMPFTVGRVTNEKLELVPSSNAASALRGKVSGVSMSQSNGSPGSDVDIILRGVTNVFSNDNSPLYIVDGVILAGSAGDIDALDIQNIEVVKGAAASSLYGSRAANGVINITTKRGKNIEEGIPQIAIRNEFGVNQLPSTPATNNSHAYKLSGDLDKPWVDLDGNPTSSRLGRALVSTPSTAFMDQEYPVKTYDHLDRLFNPGYYFSNYISIAQRTSKVNYRASFNNTQNSGIMKDADGYSRRNIRLNLDARITDNLTMAVSGYYSKSKTDDIPINNEFSPFFGLLIQGPDVDLTLRDEAGRYLYLSDPLLAYNNPLYDVAYIESTTKRNRAMGSASLKYFATDWLEFSGNISYDRSGVNSERYVPIWYQHARDRDLNGGLTLNESYSEAINSSIMATFKKQFGDLSTTTQIRALQEHTEYAGSSLVGEAFQVSGVRTIDATDLDRRTGSSSTSEIKSLGYFLITNLDYKDKYIIDAVVRRDGSSLFGEDERWHTYFRASGAYRISEENWFNVSGVDDFKLRLSMGTAGGRPNFSAQYETWSVAGSIVTKNTLGNKKLKPELATEIETGFDTFLFNKLKLSLTYATSEAEDQILQLPLISPYGFNSQWVNGGTVKSNTYEASLDYFAIQKQNIKLSFNLLFDRTRSEITKFDRPAILRDQLFYLREGEEVSTIYTQKFIETYNELETTYGGDYSSYFDRNDEGFLVPVGVGNNWKSGLWGTDVIADDGTELGNWGIPNLFVSESGDTNVSRGRTMPDFNMAFSTTLNYKGFTAYALFDGQFGGQIYNDTRQRRVRENLDIINDQAGKPELEKKPLVYYQNMISNFNSRWLEDATFVKLREVSIGYNFNKDKLQSVFGNALDNINLSLIGRNLITWTNYTGIDPEVGDLVYRRDRYQYPNFRQISANLEIKF